MRSRQDRQKAETCLGWYKAMALPEEKLKLGCRGGDDGERRAIADQVDRLVRARLKDAFRKDASGKVPRGLEKKGLMASTVSSRISELKKDHSVEVKLEDFQAWRADYEARPPSPPAQQKAAKRSRKKR